MTMRVACLVNVLGAVVLGGGGLSFAATLPPPPTEPAMAALFADAQKEFAAASSQGYIDNPQVLPAWPCPVDDKLLRGWAGVVGTAEFDDTYKRIFTRLMRDMGVKNVKQAYRDVKTAPIVAQCKDGKLDGSAEYWVDTVSETEGFGQSSTAHERYRIRVLAKAGDLADGASVSMARREFDQMIRVSDPKVQEALNKNRSETVGVTITAPGTGEVTVSEVRSGMGAGQTTVVFTTVTSPGRKEQKVYLSGELAVLSHLKDNRMHGSWEMFPTKAGGVSMKKCYENGEEVKVVTCAVD